MKPSWTMGMIRLAKWLGLPAWLVAWLSYPAVQSVIIGVISTIVVGLVGGIGMGIGCNHEPPRFCPPAFLPTAPTPERE